MAAQIGIDPVTFKNEYQLALSTQESAQTKAKQQEEESRMKAEKLALDMEKIGYDMSKPFTSGGYIYQKVGNEIKQIGLARSTAEPKAVKAEEGLVKFDKDVTNSLVKTGETNESIKALQDAINTYGLQAVLDDEGTSKETEKALRSYYGL